jgi:hypothetical protein
MLARARDVLSPTRCLLPEHWLRPVY